MMSQALYRLGRLAARRAWVMIGWWLVLSVLVIGAAIGFGHKLVDSPAVPGLDSQQATDLLAAAKSGQDGLTAQVVVTPADPTATFFDSAAARAALARVQAGVAALPHVLGTSDPVGALAAGRQPGAARRVVSPDGRVALIRVQYPQQAKLTQQDLQNLKDIGAQAGGSVLRIEMGGDLFFAFEGAQTGIGEVLGLVAAVVILLLAFGSLIAMGLPIGMAVFGLALGISSMSLIAYLVDIPSWAPVLGSMVGLGVGIDYALFIVTRHREYLARGMSVQESVGRAIAAAGQPVVFAGGIVVIAILGLAVADVPFITAGGIAVSVVVLVMVAASVTLLPAFLSIAGNRINRLGRRRDAHNGNDAYAGNTAGPAWQHWVEHVTRHAWAYVIGVTVLLLALAAPGLALRVGIPDDGALPPTRTERQAYDLAAAGFGPGINGPLIIAVDISQDPSIVRPLRHAVSADKGIAAVMPPEVNAGSGVATLVAFPTTGPQDVATHDTIERLRTELFPRVLGRSPARAHIGGQTASFADVGARVNQRLPLFIAAVILLSFLLLTLVFRSVLVPLKAALMNLLSIGASYGVMVMVFQWGWGASIIGLQSTVPIVSFIPMFMFAILFGLSMDYEVFLLSRIREEYFSTGDNHASVIRGIASTGRVITSAALIMVSVFLGFVVAEDAATKMFGLGLATAIFIDATLVRMVLVPAVMKLIGKANWWTPAWLNRLLPAIHGEQEARPAIPGLAADLAPEASDTQVGV